MRVFDIKDTPKSRHNRIKGKPSYFATTGFSGGSSYILPGNWIPAGRVPSVNPMGTVNAGCPVWGVTACSGGFRVVF